MTFTTKDLAGMIDRRTYLSFAYQKKIDRIRVSAHAYQRWKERVSTQNISRLELEDLINELYQQGRMEVQELAGKIDGDILFTYKKDKERELTITTFYGRISNRFILSNWRYLKGYNKQKKEQINLALSDSELAQQPPVAVASDMVRLPYERKKYIIETFETTDKGTVYVLNVKRGRGIDSVLLEKLDVLKYPVLAYFNGRD